MGELLECARWQDYFSLGCTLVVLVGVTLQVYLRWSTEGLQRRILRDIELHKQVIEDRMRLAQHLEACRLAIEHGSPLPELETRRLH